MSTPKGASGSDSAINALVIDDSQFPEQRHAGKVGYGPNYNKGPSIVDRVSGLVDEVRGKATHNPQLVHLGQEKYSGELKRKQLLGEGSGDPFANAQANNAKPDTGSSQASRANPEMGSSRVMPSTGPGPAAR